jgi:hypothetical protein
MVSPTGESALNIPAAQGKRVPSQPGRFGLHALREFASVAARIGINLYRVDNYAGTVDVMAQMSTTDESASADIVSLEDYPIDYGTVSYPTYSYYVGACLTSSAIRLYSVRLWYTPAPLPPTKPKVVVVPLN